MYVARIRIKYRGKWYAPGEQVPAEVSAMGSDFVEFRPEPAVIQEADLRPREGEPGVCLGGFIEMSGAKSLPDNDQCTHVKENGERCKRDAVEDSGFCKQHQPKEEKPEEPGKATDANVTPQNPESKAEDTDGKSDPAVSNAPVDGPGSNAGEETKKSGE
ncbi:DUF5763 domain-containing protein [bacterium]|nr:DUF5763 domain-containing protein [bacterium]